MLVCGGNTEGTVLQKKGRGRDAAGGLDGHEGDRTTDPDTASFILAPNGLADFRVMQGPQKLRD